MDRHVTRVRSRLRWGLAVAPLALALVLAGCSSGGGGSGGTTPQQSANDVLKASGKTLQTAVRTYLTEVSGCATHSSPVVCLETADHTLGDKIHHYANMLASHARFTAPRKDLTATLNSAQTLANSLEILGDAQPTQANYNQVLNTFNINAAITQLQGDIATLNGSLGT